MRRGGLWWWLAAALGAWAQASGPVTVATRIWVAEPGGRARAAFFVDGTEYTNAVTLLWPEGSKHVLSLPAVQEIAAGIRWEATGWSGVHVGGVQESKLDGLTLAVTAHRDLVGFRAEGVLKYRLQVQLVSEGSAGIFGCVPGPEFGKVYVNGECLASHGELWLPADSEVVLQAYPPPGYVLEGWQGESGISQAFESRLVLNRPMVLALRLRAAVRVRLETEPPELELLADRTRVRAPITLEWGEGSEHRLAPVSPQMDAWGRWWVFESWSNGGPAQQVYVPQKANVAERVVARFVPGAAVSFLTEPPGLKLVVDGREQVGGGNYIWGVGQVHRVEAPSEQVYQGRRYVFRGWSNGGPAVQELAAPSEGLRLRAEYELLGRLRIESTHPVTVQVNGSGCRTPCWIEPRQGSVVRLAAPMVVPVDEWRRLEFQGWSDEASAERLWTVGPAEEVLWLNYQPAYRVLGLVAPGEGGRLRWEPASTDGFYAAGSVVKVVAEPRAGYRFRYWDGDVPGRQAELTVVVSEPRIVRAVLEAAPEEPVYGVRNAAGETPEGVVAAGSLIAIYGRELAAGYLAGPENPLAQSLGGVTVSLGDRLLPLKFVAPEQINAQLPWDLSEGEYRLRVRRATGPDVELGVRVVRNAPGLFTREVEGRTVALALHEDGTLVEPSRPARLAEVVTVLGTGFGPYRQAVPEGFAAPEGWALELVDEVEILAGDPPQRPLWAGAAVGQVGVAALRFRVTEAYLGAPEFRLQIRIRGRLSNPVALPVEGR